MFWIFPSAEVTLVQCCVCQWHLFCKFPNTISPIWSLVLRPSLAMHFLIPCNRQKQAVFSWTLEIKISPEVHKQRSLRIYLSCGSGTATCSVGTVSVWNLCLSRLWWGRRTWCCLHLWHGSRFKKLSWWPCDCQAALSQMTSPAQLQAPRLCLLGAPPGAQTEQCSWHETLRTILVIPMVILSSWEARD